MAIRLPDFKDEYLDAIYVCASADKAGVRGSGDWIGSPPMFWESSYPLGDDSLATIRLMVEQWPENLIHFHVNVARQLILDNADEFESVSIEQLCEVIDRLSELKVRVWLGSQFCLALDDLPKRGIMASLLGISTEACGQELHLTGASMKIESDLFTKVKWELDDDGDIDIKINAETSSVVSEDYLVDFAELMRDGLDCFVFESPPDKNEHDDRIQRPTMQKKERGA